MRPEAPSVYLYDERSTDAPRRYTDEIFRVLVMSSNGFASSTMKSALLFGSIVPVLLILRNCAPLLVAATITCVGLIPAATMSAISKCGAYGVFPSVPIGRVFLHCFARLCGRRYPVRRGRASRFRRGDPAPGRKEPRQARHRLRTNLE